MINQPKPRPDQALRQTLTDIITTAAANAPRSQQKRIGPSEVGTECPRKLGYKLANWPATNTGGDPWPSVVGTATHAWLADALKLHNRMLGRERFLVEERVTVRGGLTGSCDAFDLDTHMVLDHKCVGETAMRKYKTKGPGEQYRAQAHLYGLGWENAGYHPRTVALAFYPRGGMLGGLHVWTEPYSRQVALDALERLDAVDTLINTLDVHARPAMWEHVPAKASSACRWCPWFTPASTDPSVGCPGNVAAPTSAQCA